MENSTMQTLIQRKLEWWTVLTSNMDFTIRKITRDKEGNYVWEKDKFTKKKRS